MLAVCLSKLVDLLEQVTSTIGIQESEWTSTKWRESQTKYSTNITINWTVQDPILKTPDCLVDEPGGETKLNLFNVVTACVMKEIESE